MTAQAMTRPAPSIRWARLAVTAIFFVCGVLSGTWVARIPAIQQSLEISKSTLGLALLSAAAGSLVSMPFVGMLVGRWGSRPVTSVLAIALCCALPWLAVAPTLPALVVALFVYGACIGSLDVAMNSAGAAVEQGYRRSIMTAFHAWWSLGGLAGAALGGVIANAGWNQLQHFSLAASVGIVGMIAATRGLLPAQVDAAGGPAFARPTRALAALGVIAFCALVSEGAMADWSAVYLHQTLGTTEGFAAYGYAAVSLMMAAGRLTGTALVQRFGAAMLVRASGVLVAVGLSVAILGASPLLALIGFGCVGAGLSTIFPLVLSAAATTPNTPAGTAIAAMSTVGYGGFLVGPPLIGLVADATSLRVGLGVVVVMAATIAVLAPATRNAGEAAH